MHEKSRLKKKKWNQHPKYIQGNIKPTDSNWLFTSVIYPSGHMQCANFGVQYCCVCVCVYLDAAGRVGAVRSGWFWEAICYSCWTDWSTVWPTQIAGDGCLLDLLAGGSQWCGHWEKKKMSFTPPVSFKSIHCLFFKAVRNHLATYC